jgi:hypothetical protein
MHGKTALVQEQRHSPSGLDAQRGTRCAEHRDVVKAALLGQSAERLHDTFLDAEPRTRHQRRVTRSPRVGVPLAG